MAKTIYKNRIESITTAKRIQADKCNAISFFNVGTGDLTINGMLLPAGTQISFNGNRGEVDVTDYDVIFLNNGTNILNVVRKIDQII